MNVLITGGAGFIGSHIAKYHILNGNNVWVVDSLITGKRDTLQDLENHKNFKFTQADVSSWEDMPKAIEWADTIYHMAALLGMKYVLTHAHEVLSTNIHALENVLLHAKKSTKTKKIIVASSSCVYGSKKSSVDDTEETSMVINSGRYLQETYSASKIINEVMSLCYSDNPHMHIVIARLFNVIGPHQTGRYGMVVPRLIKQAIQNQPLTVYGDGTQTRSFCSVHDVIKILETLIQNPVSKNQIYNIGSEFEISIDSLAHKILKLTDSQSKIQYISYEDAYKTPYEDIKRRKPNTNKMASVIGFKPDTPLDKILGEIILSIKSELL